MPDDEEFRPSENASLIPLNSGWQVSNLTLDTKATGETEIDTSPLAQRRVITIKNLDTTDTIYVGPTSAVNTSGANRGWEIGPLEEASFAFGPGMDFFGVADTDATAIQVIEAA